MTNWEIPGIVVPVLEALRSLQDPESSPILFKAERQLPARGKWYKMAVRPEKIYVGHPDPGSLNFTQFSILNYVCTLMEELYYMYLYYPPCFILFSLFA